MLNDSNQRAMQTYDVIVALFDLDYTLLDGDCEYLWSDFLFKNKLVDARFVDGIARYYEDYEMGSLDIFEYEAYLLQPLKILPIEKLLRLRKNYLDLIPDLIRPSLVARLEWHRAQKHELLLITASNSFLAEPIAKMLRFSNLICTQVEVIQNKFTGNIIGIPAFRDGKTQLLDNWLSQRGLSLNGSWGYGDSHNDLPLLQMVEHAVAVTPDPVLNRFARKAGWEIINE
jgi:HAD superfamily hydrolase (TIGR01490 family)